VVAYYWLYSVLQRWNDYSSTLKQTHLWDYNAGRINFVCNYNEIKWRRLFKITVIHCQTAFYNSFCFWKNCRLGFKFGVSLGALRKPLRKASIDFLMSVLFVCLSVCLFVFMEQGDIHWTDFCEILYLGFLKICRHIPVLVKMGRKSQTTCVTYCAHLYLTMIGLCNSGSVGYELRLKKKLSMEYRSW
jgi:hypothetical protein